MRTKGFLILLATGIMLITASTAWALEVGWDYVIFQSDAAAYPGSYDAFIDMTLDGNMLNISLTNITPRDQELKAAGNLLTGLGWELPTGVYIGSGSAVVGSGSSGRYKDDSSPPLYIPLSEGDDVSGEYGYMNTVDKSFFSEVPEDYGVDVVVASMESPTDYIFGTPLAKPAGLDGPEFGIGSGVLDPSAFGGLNYIQDTINISLNLVGLSGIYLDPEDGELALINFIREGNVIISFGSPDAIPEPSTLLLFGSGMLAAGIYGRRKTKKKMV